MTTTPLKSITNEVMVKLGEIPTSFSSIERWFERYFQPFSRICMKRRAISNILGDFSENLENTLKFLQSFDIIR
jgi:hypothetical protein